MELAVLTRHWSAEEERRRWEEEEMEAGNCSPRPLSPGKGGELEAGPTQDHCDWEKPLEEVGEGEAEPLYLQMNQVVEEEEEAGP